MKRNHSLLISLLALAVGFAWAQESSSPPPAKQQQEQQRPVEATPRQTHAVPENSVLRVFQLKHQRWSAVEQVIDSIATKIVDGSVQRLARTTLLGNSAIAVYAPPDLMSRIENAIAEIDVPRSLDLAPELSGQAKLLFYMLSTGATESKQPMPEALRPVVTELQDLFPGQDYALIDAMPLVVKFGAPTKVTSVMPSPGNQSPAKPETGIYSLILARIRQAPGHVGTATNGYEILFDARVGGANLYVGSQIDIAPGESVVVGKVRHPQTQSDLFVVLHMPPQ